MSMGSIGVALTLDKDALTETRRAWIDRLGALKAGDFQSAMAAAEALAGNREETLRFLKWAESWYRDLLISRMTSQAGRPGEFGYASASRTTSGANRAWTESARRWPTPSTLESEFSAT